MDALYIDRWGLQPTYPCSVLTTATFPWRACSTTTFCTSQERSHNGELPSGARLLFSSSLVTLGALPPRHPQERRGPHGPPCHSGGQIRCLLMSPWLQAHTFISLLLGLLLPPSLTLLLSHMSFLPQRVAAQWLTPPPPRHLVDVPDGQIDLIWQEPSHPTISLFHLLNI
jgi:hypothetical protein